MEFGKKYGVNLFICDVMYCYGGDIYFKFVLENLIYKIDVNRKKILVWKFDCLGKDVDVFVNEIDFGKCF